MASQTNDDDDPVDVGESRPLREWLEAEMISHQHNHQNQSNHVTQPLMVLIRKTTVAYAVAALLQEAISIAPLTAEKVSLDYFIVRTKKQEVKENNQTESFCETPADDIILGVDMISEKLSLAIIQPSSDGGGLEVRITSPPLPGSSSSSSAFEQMKESTICQLFGVLLYQLYSNLDPFLEKNLEGVVTDQDGVILDARGEKAERRVVQLTYSTLRELGAPPIVCMLVQHLGECKECDGLSCNPNTYSSLKEAKDDLHLLLLEPDRFLSSSDAFKGGRPHLLLQRDRLYGREREVSVITDAFSRVCAGESVALFIGGFSGSGKTRLVQSVVASVGMSGGYVLEHKFDQASKDRALLQLISAFNKLCVLIGNTSSKQNLQIVVNKLTETFGSDLTMLGRLLPGVHGLVPQSMLSKQASSSGDGAQMNLQSVCFILQQFMRIVSSTSHPVMIFLDDLQWCDGEVMKVIHQIISSKSAGSSCFFVGSYRSNEVSPDHAVFHLMENLASSKVATQKLLLDGVKVEDLNTLISDSLRTFPRLTRGLSAIIHEKTEGNPFFFLQFLRILVDRDLLHYSAQLERWEWDEDKIKHENITNNVLCLLSDKMCRMTTEVQMALKVLSSFGIEVNENILTYLSSTSQFSDILSGVEVLISDGFVSRVGNPTSLAFAHDKIKEAAYRLIPDDEKDEFHSKLGEALRSASKNDSLDDATILTIADQINHNLSALKQSSSSMCVEVASLNYQASQAAMNRSDYNTATSYLGTALQLFPDNHWQSNYALSLCTYMALAKAAYSTGNVEKSEATLKRIFKEATSLEDKLDAYYLYINLLHSQERGEEAHLTSQYVLEQLGEKIPEFVTPEENKSIIEETIEIAMNHLTEEKLLKMKVIDEKSHPIIKFINLMGTVTYFSKPELIPYLNLRFVKVTLETGLCKYSLVGLLCLAFILGHDRTYFGGGDEKKTLPKECMQMGYKIGTVAWSMTNRFDYADLMGLSSFTFGSLSLFSDVPIQKCAEIFRKGFEFGIACGDTVYAFLNAMAHIRISILTGSNLPNLLREADNYLALIGRHGSKFSRIGIVCCRQTVSTLIDNGENTSLSSDDNEEKEKINEETYSEDHSRQINYHKAQQCFWLGHHERCYRCIEKLLQVEGAAHYRLTTIFYHGLNSFALMRKGKFVKRCSQVFKAALAELLKAEELSKWNYRNKVYLLQAEKHSFKGRDEEARTSYGSAIIAARTSKFVHEQGLACECAGFHCKRMGDLEQAWRFFNQARICYEKWGSSMKVEFVTRQMDELPDPDNTN